MQDTVIFETKDVKISQQFARMGETSYPIRNISAVSVRKISQVPTGILAAIIGASAIATGLLNETVWLAALGSLLLLVAVAMFLGTKHAVVLQTNAGSVDGMKTGDPALASHIRDAIERAIASH